MKSRPSYILLLSFLLSFSFSFAQQSLSYGIDPQRDSVVFARYRSHMDTIRSERPTVALVLSGGGAKGAAHISVIRHLEKAGIPIDLVVGTSIGGLIGGLYASGYDGEQLETLIRNLDWDNLLRDPHPRSFDALAQKDYDRQYQLSIPFGSYRWDFHRPEISRRSLLRDGIVQGRNIEDLLASLLIGHEDETEFINLPIPFACVASDMISAKPKVWCSGSLVEAMRSSMSIPGLFTPVRRDGMVLMDGAMRNNYPAEIAKQMGADIIIGVDISSPSLDASQFRSMIDIVTQANDVLGRESYLAGLKVTDIYIQPQLNDFTLLSFDSKSIDSILLRGRQAAEAADPDIEALAQRLGNPNIRRSHNPYIRKAGNLNNNIALVNKTQFQGINPKEERYLRNMLHIQDGERYIHIVELEEYISSIIGTKAFEKVTYQILGDTAPYTLQFNCFRAPINQLGASVRFDSRDFASILLHYGINTHQLTGSRLDFSARLGFDMRLSAGYTIVTGRGINFGTTLSFQSVHNGDFRTGSAHVLGGNTGSTHVPVGTSNYSINFNRGIADAHIDLAPWRRMNMRLGFQLDYFYRTSFLTDNALLVHDFDALTKSNIYPSAYLLLRHDSFDNAYFPTEGLMYHLRYNHYFKGLQHDTPQINSAQFGLNIAAGWQRLTFIPSLNLRYVSHDIYPYSNMLSVSNANRPIDHQITFVAISTPYSTMRLLASLGLDTRLQIAKKHYLTASAQVLHEADGFNQITDPDKSQSHIGFALEYAYSSIVGPLRFNTHWSDFNKSLGFYLSIGLDF